MTRTNLIELVEAAFNASMMRKALIEEIADRIDYSDLARNVLDAYVDDVDILIEELATEAIDA